MTHLRWLTVWTLFWTFTVLWLGFGVVGAGHLVQGFVWFFAGISLLVIPFPPRPKPKRLPVRWRLTVAQHWGVTAVFVWHGFFWLAAAHIFTLAILVINRDRAHDAAKRVEANGPKV